MARCEQCGNDYDKSFEVTIGGRTMIFDSFECAIQALAPTCPHCGCRIIGHGVSAIGIDRRTEWLDAYQVLSAVHDELAMATSRVFGV